LTASLPGFSVAIGEGEEISAMSVRLIFAAVAMVVPLIGTAHAQTSPTWQRCINEPRQVETDEQIAACTTLIDGGQESRTNLAAAHVNRGIALRRKGDSDKALADYDEAVRLQPDVATAFNGRGGIYNDRKEYDRAIAQFDEALRLRPGNPQFHNNRGNAWLGKRDFERALRDYEEAIRLDPKYVSPYNGRGAVYLEQRQYDRAITEFDAVLRLVPDHRNAILNRQRAIDAKAAGR
jgi:tetratricopeptide (TPR) repeat protein